MTLLEVLIIVVILALAYGTLINGLLTHSESGQQRLALAMWRQIDGTARQMAVAGGRSMLLEIALDEWTAHCRMNSTDEVMATRSLTARLILRDSADTSVLNSIQIDGRGCSGDYVIRAAGSAFDSSGVWKVLGLTGQWVEVDSWGGFGEGGGGQ